MLENRDYMRAQPDRFAFRWTATMVLIVVNIVAFILQNTVIPAEFEARYLNLSAYGILHGYLWQLLTFQILHGGLGHVFFNCLTLFMFGRMVESTLGWRRFVSLYVISGIFGGVLHIAAAFMWPGYFNLPVVGASAGIFGIIAAFAMLFPDQPLLLMFFIPMRARTLLWIELVIAALGIAFPASSLMQSLFGNTAHTAHFGGILAGLAFIRWQESGWTLFKGRSSGRATFSSPPWARAQKTGHAPGEFISNEVDPILDKISAHGIQSLTDRERKILEAARNKMAKR
ncbi:MAG: rhomboid family intramembrane serine protease [Verrucomicrobiota bacterium]